ncbi:hypothetical protein [uncultured Piscinibacter sp.]|uniref:hypothetical protein n=1 Tax=uncultured Piscinibacter sp. TaxID=1131835 RepID=UPI0026364B6F|nr:hypothetical protein [uncultured Piscinibacter sp.]
MAAKPHVVRNGYIALKNVDDAVLRCWAGDIVDVPAAWVDMLARQGVIEEGRRPAGYGAPPAPASEAVIEAPAAEAVQVADEPPADEPPSAAQADVADVADEPPADEGEDPPPVRRRGRSRRRQDDGGQE